VISINAAVPDVPLPTMGQEGPVAHNGVIGAIVGSVLTVGLVLSGLIFILRRRMSKSRRVVDTNCAMPTMPSHSASSKGMGQRGSGIIKQYRIPHLEHNIGAATWDSTLTVAAIERQCTHPARCSQISGTSSASRSIRFAISGGHSGSHHSSSNSYSSRATISMIVDAGHALTADPLANPSPPRRPISLNVTADHSASWRGANLSNIINAARGVKHNNFTET